MASILDNIQSRQYNPADSTIANADGVLGQVKTAESTARDVDVTPIQEGTSGRKVYTAVELLPGSTVQQATAVNQATPLVRVLQQAGTAGQVYGALETVNTDTQRCGVLTDGIVVLRRTSGSTAATSDVGRSIIGSSSGSNDDHGTVDVGSGTDLGKGIIISYVDRYLLVDLSR